MFTTDQPIRQRRHPCRRGCVVVLVLALSACTQGNPSPAQLDRAYDKAITSPIPGAHAVLFPTAGGTGSATAAACVTDAGYCLLPTASQAGLNCLCDTGSASYGGHTGVPPKTAE